MSETEKTPVILVGEVCKVDVDQMLVFGWASVSTIKGKLVVDSQGDVIHEVDLEKTAYKFVLNARVGGDMHKLMGVSRLVESMVFTLEKQRALGIDLGFIGWWVGFKVDDPESWQRTKRGERQQFSIGGRGLREEFTDAL